MPTSAPVPPTKPHWLGVRDSPGLERSRVSGLSEQGASPWARVTHKLLKESQLHLGGQGCPPKPLPPQPRQRLFPPTPSRVVQEDLVRGTQQVLTEGRGEGTHLCLLSTWSESLAFHLGKEGASGYLRLAFQFHHLFSEIPGTGSG